MRVMGTRVVIASAVAVVVAILVVISVGERGTYLARPETTPPPRVSEAGAAVALAGLEAAIQDRDEQAAVAVAAPQARGLLADVTLNARALSVEDFSMRYVDEVSPVNAAGEWDAAVDLTWRFRDYDDEPVHLEMQMGFVQVSDQTLITSLGGGDRRSPLWLSGPVEVRSAKNSLVLAAEETQVADTVAQRPEIAVLA